MMVYTAHASYKGDDKLDISRGSATDGILFAPSRELLDFFGAQRSTEGLSQKEWEHFVQSYKQEMRDSYRNSRAAWKAILQRPRVTLTCSCTRAEQCHRTVLAKEILVPLGADFKGEWQVRLF